ncbi:MAG: folylpolyglutamate synthase/dihydrofolate synthase family protein [Ketobacteraceae bacterium]|nr:folylpolyglutamate synthase/dihydrofolate synthase family protein [Ketobacteraceae bacterium]
MKKPLGQWLAMIESMHPAEIELGLERICKVYLRLPQLCDPVTVFTVAGTNGKGSTVKSIEALGMALGKRVGTYTSPHLLSYNERIQINQENASDQLLVDAFEEIEAVRADIPLTYFEFGTLAALVIFARADLDWIVLEVGLGGRLDAVNIVDPDVAVITTIDMDHENWLGDTREKIGYEKAGIIRKSSVVVCGDSDPPVSVKEKAQQAKWVCYRGREFDVAGDSFTCAVVTDRHREAEPENRKTVIQRFGIPASSPVLVDNLITGVQAVAAAGESLHQDIIDQAAARIQLAGRQQLVGGRPRLLLDVGHNPQAAGALAGRIRELRESLSPSSVVCIVGMLADKNHKDSLSELVPVVDEWYPVTLDAGSRSQPGATLAAIVSDLGGKVRAECPSPLAALRQARTELPDDALVVVFGSFYTVSDILAEA